MTNTLKNNLTLDIKKTFDSVNFVHKLEKPGFGKNFIKWIKSCIINEGKTTMYFKLNKGTRQGDSILASFFISVLEVVFAVIKPNQKNSNMNFYIQHMPLSLKVLIGFQKDLD